MHFIILFLAWNLNLNLKEVNVMAIHKVNDDRQGCKCKRHMASYTINISKSVLFRPILPSLRMHKDNDDFLAFYFYNYNCILTLNTLLYKQK